MVKRNLGLAIAGAIALVLIVIELVRPSTTSTPVSFEIERARLAKCLVGHPIEATTPVDDELRRIELGARLAKVATWPGRCAPHVQALEHAKEDARAAADRITSAMREASPDLVHPDHFYESLHVASAIVEAIRPERGAPPIDWDLATKGVEGPPAPLVIPDRGSTLPGELDQPAGRADLVLRSATENVTCRFAAANGDLEPIARCRYDADALAGDPGQRWLIPSTLDTPTYVRSRATGDVRDAATGEVLIRGEQVAIMDDRAIAWPADGRYDAALLRPNHGAARRIALDRPHGEDQRAILVRDQLVWTEGDTLYARAINDKPGPVVAIAKGKDWRWEGSCFTPTVVAVALDGDQLAVLAGGTWTLTRGRAFCVGDAAIAISASGGQAVRTDCTAAGCRESRQAIPDRNRLAIAPFGKGTIAAWVDDLVHVQLPDGTSTVLLDGYAESQDYVHQAQVLVSKVDVFARGTSAIVVIRAGNTLAIHVDRDGHVTPVHVAYE